MIRKCLFTFLSSATILLCNVWCAHATIIVDLDPADVRFDSLIHNDDGGGGYGAGDPGGQNANGLTFNVTFTPVAGDLDSTTQPVLLIEVGGDANGTGMYMLDGEVHFISKMNGGGGDVPGTFNDLDWASGNNMIGAQSSFGKLTAGVEYSVAAVFDPLTSATLQLGIQPAGGAVFEDSFALSNIGGKTNWSGDDSAAALRTAGLATLANYGGANQGASVWGEAAMTANPFEGTAGQALYWSLNAAIIPEPSSFALWLLGFSGVAHLLRRKHQRDA